LFEVNALKGKESGHQQEFQRKLEEAEGRYVPCPFPRRSDGSGLIAQAMAFVDAINRLPWIVMRLKKARAFFATAIVAPVRNRGQDAQFFRAFQIYAFHRLFPKVH
jgi:hypothetical protein